MNVEEYLNEYRQLTLQIIDKINTTGNIRFLIEERDIILNKLHTAEFDKEEIIKVGEALDLLNLDKEMNMLLKKELVNIKKKIQNLRKMKQVNEQYINIGYVYSSFNKRM